MRASLLNSYSAFGKYMPNDMPVEATSSTTVATINLKQNFVHERPFVNCKFDIQANRLYLLDTKGSLIHVNLADNSFSTLKSEKVKDFTIDGNNSLSLLYVTPRSELYRVSFENKKPSKIMNLNMSKILAFERNYLREMLMALDYKLLFLCDLTRSGPAKIRSLKAGNNQIFTNACFASNNRYIILAVKNLEIRIVEIMNLKTIHSIRLPFMVENLKIEVSYDSRKIAIYGDCHIVFFINVEDAINTADQFSYELMEIPFLKSIPQLKYTYQNDIVFLANDQILYAVSSEEPGRAVPIFNEEYHVRMMGFDISLDCCKVAVVSNRTVMQLKFAKGIKEHIAKMETFKQIEHRVNGFSSVEQSYRDENQLKSKIVEQPKMEEQAEERNKNYQYEDEDESEQDDEEICPAEIDLLNLSRIAKLPQMPNTTSATNSLHSQIGSLCASPRRKQQINYILNYLVSNYRDVTLHQSENIIKLMMTMTEKYKISSQNCLAILDFVYRHLSLEYDKLEHFALVLCPEIMSIIEKRFSRRFIGFFMENLTNICINYLTNNQWVTLINWILSADAVQRTESLPVVFAAILHEILDLIHEEGNQQWSLLINPSGLNLKFSKILNRVQKIYSQQKYQHIFLRKRKISEYVQEPEMDQNPIYAQGRDSKLEELILRQEQIKRSLSQLQKQKALH